MSNVQKAIRVMVIIVGACLTSVACKQTTDSPAPGGSTTSPTTPTNSTIPSKQWNKTFGGSKDDKLTSLVSNADGGFLLGGTSESEASGDKTENTKGIYQDSDYWIVKINANGTKQWDKTFGGSEDDELTSLVSTADGGFLIGGTSESNAGGDKTEDTRSRGQPDYWVVKISANGTKEWDKTFGGYENDWLTSIVATGDGGFLLGGYSWSNIGGDKAENGRGYGDYWVVKINASGTKQWDKTFGGSMDDELTSMIITTDGGYLLGGYSESGASGDKSENKRGGRGYDRSSDYWVVKISSTGTKEWDKTFGGDDLDNLSSLVATTDGGYLLGGYSWSYAGGDKSEDNRGAAHRDYWIVKISASGIKQWDKNYGGIFNDELTALVATTDGGYLLGGYSQSNIDGDKGEKAREGSYDYWIVKINANGTKQWDKTLGGTRADWLYSTVATIDGGFLLGGYSESDAGGDKTENIRGQNDYWVVKIK